MAARDCLQYEDLARKVGARELLWAYAKAQKKEEPERLRAEFFLATRYTPDSNAGSGRYRPRRF